MLALTLAVAHVRPPLSTCQPRVPLITASEWYSGEELEVDEEYELYRPRRPSLYDRLTARRRAGDFDNRPAEDARSKLSLVPEATVVTGLFLAAVVWNYGVLGAAFPDASPSGAGSGGSVYVTVGLVLSLGAWALANDRSRDVHDLEL